MSYQIVDGIPVWGEPVENAVRQAQTIWACGAERVILCADHHKGYSMPIGGVAAYKNLVSPSGVGYDIACGNKAVRLDLSYDQIQPHLAEIMDTIYAEISFGIGRTNRETVPAWDMIAEIPAWDIPAVGRNKELAESQLGTVGSGNHFVDLFCDEQDQVWVGVHFGSRGLGHKIASHYINAGGGKDGMDVAPVLFDVESVLGQEYMHAMHLAGMYAYIGRDWVCEKVAEIIGAPIQEEVHNHHNYAWEELHQDEKLIVVRKGATPLFPYQQAFIGGSMGDVSYIVMGLEHPDAETALYSTVHGAGRVMSRTQAAGRVRWKNGQRVQVKEGQISPEMMHEWVDKMGVELRGGGTDESPHVYKRLPEVIDYHKEYTLIERTLYPIGVAMAGPEVKDPYKD